MHQGEENVNQPARTNDLERQAVDATFQVILNGVQPNVLRSEARTKLAALFKATLEQIDRLLATPDYVVKKAISFDVASKYKSAIEAAGGMCELFPEHSPSVSLDVDLPSAAPEIADEKKAASDQTIPPESNVAAERAATPRSAGIEWHYESKGVRLGPVSEAEILSQISSGQLEQRSFVWKKGMADWTPLESTVFSSQFGHSPPPLTGQAVDNTFVWWLAFAPVLGVFIAGFLSGLTHKDIGQFWWVTLVLNIILSMIDENKLKKAGNDTSKMGASWIVPVYLFKRAKVLKQNNSYFIVWVVLFCLSLLSDL